MLKIEKEKKKKKKYLRFDRFSIVIVLLIKSKPPREGEGAGEELGRIKDKELPLFVVSDKRDIYTTFQSTFNLSSMTSEAGK